MTNKNLTDEKLKAYHDELWRAYQQAQAEAEYRALQKQSPYTYLYEMGKRAGLDFAIMTLKSMFELGEYAEGSEEA